MQKNDCINVNFNIVLTSIVSARIKCSNLGELTVYFEPLCSSTISLGCNAGINQVYIYKNSLNIFKVLFLLNRRSRTKLSFLWF